MNNFTKLFINVSSFSWVFFIYLIHNELFFLDSCLYDKYLSIVFYIIGFSLLSYLSLKLLKNFGTRPTLTFKVQKIYPVYSEFMPVYLAICVIAFELNNYTNFNNSFSVILASIFIFVIFMMSNIGYLNPFWYLVGKRIYKVENEQSNYIVILDKGDITKGITNLDNLVKFDEHTFIKMKKEI